MIQRLETCDGSHEWHVKPKYTVGTVVAYDDNCDGEIIDTITGIECFIGRMREEFYYKTARGSRLVDSQILGTLRRE